MIIILIAIFILSFILALRSMKDLNAPQEVKGLMKKNKVKGSIMFFKDNIKHYSSVSSSLSSSDEN